MKRTTKLVMAAAAFLFIGISSVAFAEDVPKDDMATGKMYSRFHRGGMGRFHGDMERFPAVETLSDEQIKKLEAQRTEFHNATRDLRQELTSKRLALKSELAKKEPDAKTARALQKDISALQSELGQKRIEHLLEMKKIAPYGCLEQFRDGRNGPRGGRFRRT